MTGSKRFLIGVAGLAVALLLISNVNAHRALDDEEEGTPIPTPTPTIPEG